MEALDAVAQRYGVTPAALIGEEDEFKAVSINLWAHNYGVQREARQMREALRKRGNRGSR
jgi:hypothetical protein